MLNSELLRHIALTMVTPTDHSGPSGSNSGQRVAPLANTLPGVLKSLTERVKEQKAKLQWSSEFYENRLFGKNYIPSPEV